MKGDSDDEIGKLRRAALLTRSSNMRKRKVTLINSKKNLARENDGDERKIVVVGANSGPPINSYKTSTTALENNENSDFEWPTAVMDSYLEKRPRLQKDRRIVGEKQVKAGEDQRIFTVSDERNEEVSSFELDEDFKTDVRIVLNNENENGLNVREDVREENKVIQIKDEDELENKTELHESINIDEDSVASEEAEVVIALEERFPLRKVVRKSSEERSETEKLNAEGEEMEESEGEKCMENFEEGQEKQLEQYVEQLGVKEKTQEEQEQEESDEEQEKSEQVEKEGNNQMVAKAVKESKQEIASQKDAKDKVDLRVQSRKNNTNVETKLKEVKTKIKESNTEKPKFEQKEKIEIKTGNTLKIHEEKKSPPTNDGSDEESSGSESDSSHSSGSSSSSSSSSSSYSGSSSSSRSSSRESRSSLSGRSNSDIDSDKKSKSSNSRSGSQSSSYSYSTGGSPDKSTMRSVVSKKEKDSRLSRSPRRSRSHSPRKSPRRSPRRSSRGRSSRGRWSPRNRRYPGRRQSYDSDERYKKDRRNNARFRRDFSPMYPRRRSPHSRLGKRSSPPQRYFRRSHSRERDRSSDMRINRHDDRRRDRSKSLEKKNNSSDKNNLSRTDDDFVEIDVRKKSEIKESRVKTSERLGEKIVNTNVRKHGFDLRSKLGPKKSEKKLVITKRIEADGLERKVDARQKLKKRQAQEVKESVKEEDEEGEKEVNEKDKQNGEDASGDVRNIERKPSSRKTVLAEQDDKEVELDAKILRIQMMNEAIRKRQEEIEREKVLFD